MFDEISILNLYQSLVTDFLQSGSDDPLFSFLQLHLLLQGITINYVMPQIKVKDLPQILLKKISKYLEPGKCYFNADIACKTIKNAHYVFGYWCLDMPLEHAWIKIGSTYYDPTYQAFYKADSNKVKGYYPVIELTYQELIKLKTHVKNQQPDLKTFFGSIGIHYAKLLG